MTMNKTSASLLPGRMALGGPWEVWRLGWMASELWMTSAYDILSRTPWLAGSDPTQAAAGREWQRMCNERLAAGLEVAMEVQRAGYDLWFGHINPWQGNRPVPRPLHRHRTGTAGRPGRRDLPEH